MTLESAKQTVYAEAAELINELRDTSVASLGMVDLRKKGKGESLVQVLYEFSHKAHRAAGLVEAYMALFKIDD